MRMLTMLLVWIACVAVGAGIGFLVGYGLFKLGLEWIGSALGIVGAAVGGVLIFMWLMTSDFGRRWL